MAEDLAGLSIPIEASTALLREQMEAAAQVVGGTTDRIDRSLSKVDKAFDRLDQASRAVKRAVGTVQKDLETAAAGVGTVAERINRSLGIVGQGTNTRSRAADIEAWGRELDRLEAKFDPVTTATKRYEAELADLEDAHRAGIVTGAAYEQQLQRIADSYDPVTVAARKLKEAAEKEAVAFQALEDRLDSHGAAARRAADDQAKLDKALAEGRISNDRYTTLTRALRDTGTAGETAAKGTKLASHELTNLTYQLQDAAVTLAGGMNPLMVLMQQGPQATSAVGGVGRAMSLLASPAGLATLGIGAVAGAFALVVAAGESYQRKLAEVSTANRMMGGQVGATADQLEQLAIRAADAASISVSAARDQEAAYIRAGKIGTESMEKLITLSRDYAAGTKQSAEEAAADLAGMFKDPVTAAEKLQASYGILTAKEMEHVRQLKATGREEEARVLVADKLAVRVRGLADTTTTFAQAWERVGRAVSNAFNAVGEAVAPETNAQAIRRLEAERQRLIDARKLDRARVDAETGGAASADAVPVDSRFSAPGTGAAGNQRMIEIEAELVRRRATEARTREQAAIRKNNQDRDRFGVEAAEITRAARPLGDQIDQVTEKVTKLRRAFGPDMAGASDETKRALSGFENQLADLQEASKRGVDLEAYKRQKLADVDKQAAGMVGPSRERYLAEQRTAIDLIGTATSATERKAQVDQAGAAAINSQTQAVAQQNAQTATAIKGQVAAADAYQQSLAAGIEADARRQAQSEAVTSAIDVEARTRQIVAEKAADQAVSLAQTTRQLDLETEAQRQVVNATDDGIAARIEAERKAQVAKTTSEALAAAQAAEATGNSELAKKLRELAAGYDNASKAASELSKLDALKQYNQQQRDGLELARKEASLVGKSADDRSRARAAYQAELQIRQNGIDVTKQLSAEQLQEVERTRQLAAETVEWQIATQHAESAWQGVGDAIDDAVVRPLESAIDAIVKGQGETVKWGNLWRAALTSLAVDFGKMALLNPAKNMLGLGSNSPSLWDLQISGVSGQAGQASGAAGTLNNASTLISAGRAGWSLLNGGAGLAATQYAGSFATSSLGEALGLSTSAAGVIPEAAATDMMLTSTGNAVVGAAGTIGAAMPYGVIGGIGGSYIANNYLGGSKVGGALTGAALGAGSAGLGASIWGLGAVGGPWGIAAAAVISAIMAAIGTQKPSVGPNMSGNVTLNGKGGFRSDTALADNGADAGQMQSVTNAVAGAMNTLVTAIGGKVTGGDGLNTGLLQYFAKDDKWYVTPQVGDKAGQKAEFASQDEALAYYMRESLKGLIGTGQLTGANDDVKKALETSKATKAEDLATDLSFAAGFRQQFDAMNAALDPVNNQIKTFTEAAKAIGEQVKTNITDWRDKASELGLATEGDLTAAARKGITAMMGLGPAVEPLRGVAAVTKQAEIEFEQFRPALLSLGYTAAEVADLATQYTAKLVKARADAVALTQRQGAASIEALVDPLAKTSALDRLTGLGLDRNNSVITGLAQAIDAVEASARRGTLTIGEERHARELLDQQLDAGYLTADQYTTAIGYLTQAWADSAQVAQALASYQSDLASRMQTVLGNSRGAGLLTLDAQQARQLADARAAGYDVGQLIQVQAAERATRAYELANADLLAAYDQQISAQQDLITGLQEGAVAAAKVADQFIKARNSLAISDDAPISPGEKLAEAARQWNEALATVRSDTASESAKTDARAVLTQLGPTLVSIEKANSAGTARTWYDAVMQVFGELGDKTALGVDTADQQLEAAQDTLKELQQGRKDAANAAQKQYGAITDLKSVAEQSKAEMLAALAPLQRLSGSAVTAPHYSAPAQVQAAWDGLSGAQQLGIARAMGWGGQLDEAFNVWLAMDSGRATAFGANVTSIAGGARYAAPEDVGRAWEALTQAQQLAAVRAAGYDGGIDGGLNAWVQLGHHAAFEAAVRAQAHSAQVPGFATGGMHVGGLRIVGERGPELEATGPARIWTADQIATAVSAARGELGPTVVGFLPAALGGGGGIATLVKAVEAVGGRIDRLSGQIETFARAGAQQAADIGTDMVRALDRIQDELQDLPVRIAGAS
ncbi:Phage-related minor tail protein [Azospirillum oryzae]|uniref:Phage-related minor tail protein n=1 Tax=Azospirillum oryzae TaxID=286727 RepID=A0A1X7HBR3_9PROT|nr:phage tail length tape measure family protein [Azospirillum oryzae]SMF83209.1 Phage-related minor tail protein [Azospirillum oryzae]